MIRVFVLVMSVLSGCWCKERLVFPPGFMFGASTSAPQVEGAWNTSGKSEHIWDRLAHTRPDVVAGGANGDVACDSYHLWRRDIDMMEELGLNMYRFSISWTRILPSGFPNHVNPVGARYYSELIDALLAKGIQPVVTLYHFDLPQSLQDLGTYDYFALNHYTSRTVHKARPGEKIGAWPFYGSDEVGAVLERRGDWGASDFDWLGVYPEGLRNLLHLLNTSYGPMDILITENGYASADSGLNDQGRLEYIQGYLEQVLLAINDGIRVIAYSPWSLMDNFEWFGGYTVRFGLYAVNFSDPLRPRTPRDSARYYAAVTRSRAVHSTHNPLNYI